MNVFTMIKRMQKEAKKLSLKDNPRVPEELKKQAYEVAYKRLYEENLECYVDAMQFMQDAKELAKVRGLLEDRATRTYFITIRPDDRILAFSTFYEVVKLYLTRTCFEWYYASFEQKGMCEADLGKGYHVHIIAKMQQRSKGEVLRITASSFKHIVEENFIEVEVTKNPEQLKQNYLIDYKSDDKHKEETKEWDKKWREREGLKDLYTELDPMVCRLTSPLAAEENGNIRVTFD